MYKCRCGKVSSDFEVVGIQYIDDEDWELVKEVMLPRTFLLEGRHGFLLLNCPHCGTTASHHSLGISNQKAKKIGKAHARS